MPIWVTFIAFAAALFLVIKGSDWFVGSAVSIAEVFNIPQVIIGATLVSFGTTLPELFVSSTAAIKGDTSVSLSNALGSIACNTGLILAIVILVSAPFLNRKNDILRNGFMLLGLLIFVAGYGVLFKRLDLAAGIILLFILCVFVYMNIRSVKTKPEYSENNDKKNKKITLKTILFFFIGMGFTVLGSVVMVNTGTDIAIFFHVPSSVIGFTMLAIGTSLPELITAITSLVKKAQGVAIGNVLGANILNIVLVTAVSCLIKPVDIINNNIPLGLVRVQIPIIFFIIVTLILFVLVAKKRIPRVCGAIMALLYALFVSITTMGSSFPIQSIANLF